MIATRILRRPRALIVGCGDVGMRCVAQWRDTRRNLRIFALTSHPARRDELRAAGATPIVGDLDRRATLAALRVWPARSCISHRRSPMAVTTGARVR